MAMQKTIATSSREPALVGFQPQCLSCTYSLAGLPEGLCPECGEAFTFEDLQLAAQEAARRRRFSIVRVGIGIFFGFMLLTFVGALIEMAQHRTRTSAEFHFLPSLLFGSLWFVCALGEGDRSSRHQLAWSVLVLQSLVAVLMDSINAQWLFVPAFVAGFFLVSYLLKGFANRDRVSIRLWLMAMLLTGTATVAGGLDVVTSWHSLDHWSPWADPRPGQVYQQYPLKYGELAWMVAISLIATIGSAIMYVRALSAVCKGSTSSN